MFEWENMTQAIPFLKSRIRDNQVLDEKKEKRTEKNLLNVKDNSRFCLDDVDSFIPEKNVPEKDLK